MSILLTEDDVEVVLVVVVGISDELLEEELELELGELDELEELLTVEEAELDGLDELDSAVELLEEEDVVVKGSMLGRAQPLCWMTASFCVMMNDGQEVDS